MIVNFFAVCSVLALLPMFRCQDTIFAKGGTCLYKIRKQWDACMDKQKARLVYERDHIEQPIYTRAAMTNFVNKISCCTHWKFLSCIEVAAREHCPNERHDMVAYSRQLGSAVPVEICAEEFPRDSHHCREFLGSFSSSNIPVFTLTTMTALMTLVMVLMV